MTQLSRCLKCLFKCMRNNRAGNIVCLTPCVTEVGKLQLVTEMPVFYLALMKVFSDPAPDTPGGCHTGKDPFGGERLFSASFLISWVSTVLSSPCLSVTHAHTLPLSGVDGFPVGSTFEAMTSLCPWAPRLQVEAGKGEGKRGRRESAQRGNTFSSIVWS